MKSRSAIMICGAGAVLYAQEPIPAPPHEWYTSTAGIIVATMIVVSVLKRALGAVPYANSIPTWLYAVAVSAVLTYLTVAIWGTITGELWKTMSQVVIAAGASSGFYEWLNNGTKSLARSAKSAGVKVPASRMPTRDRS